MAHVVCLSEASLSGSTLKIEVESFEIDLHAAIFACIILPPIVPDFVIVVHHLGVLHVIHTIFQKRV